MTSVKPVVTWDAVQPFMCETCQSEDSLSISNLIYAQGRLRASLSAERHRAELQAGVTQGHTVPIMKKASQNHWGFSDAPLQRVCAVFPLLLTVHFPG